MQFQAWSNAMHMDKDSDEACLVRLSLGVVHKFPIDVQLIVSFDDMENWVGLTDHLALWLSGKAPV